MVGGHSRASRALVAFLTTMGVAGSVAVGTGAPASAEPGGIVISQLNYNARSGLVTGAPASAEPGGIVISELNYNAVSGLDTGDWVELTNTGTTPIDISGWSFTSGVSGILPPGSIVPGGGYYVVAKDATAFAATNGF